MQSLQRLSTSKTLTTCFPNPSSGFVQTLINLRLLSGKSSSNNNANDEWNDAWESAWLPEDLSAKSRAPWENDVTSPITTDVSNSELHSEVDAETKAFVEDMNENWSERRKAPKKEKSLYSLENVQRDYRLKKQRIHAGLWMKEIEKQEEAKLGDPAAGDGGGGDDIQRLLDSCSEIFDSPNNDSVNSKVPSTSELKYKPDGWETTSKAQDGNIWEMSQREEDILLQEFERRIAFCKFQIASFIKTHIFSRRRPIDGWKYMIEELGPNARKGKGSVSRLPNFSDASTQPFKEEKMAIDSNLTSFKGR